MSVEDYSNEIRTAEISLEGAAFHTTATQEGFTSISQKALRLTAIFHEISLLCSQIQAEAQEAVNSLAAADTLSQAAKQLLENAGLDEFSYPMLFLAVQSEKAEAQNTAELITAGVTLEYFAPHAITHEESLIVAGNLCIGGIFDANDTVAQISIAISEGHSYREGL